MTTISVTKNHLVGTGYAEMPMNGRRYRFQVERYRHDDGTEYGRIVGMEEIPDVGPYLWIPSYGLDASETQHMLDEYRYEEANPTDQDLDWKATHKRTKAQQLQSYRDGCDLRYAEAHGNKRSF